MSTLKGEDIDAKKRKAQLKNKIAVIHVEGAIVTGNIGFNTAGSDGIVKNINKASDDKNVKGILINIFGGIMQCDVLAQGLVDAAKEINLSIPLVVRLAGTNFKEGKEILDKSNLKILSASDLNDAAKKIVEAIK